MPAGYQRRAVSLVELMVVIAVIALLLGLILPAVHYARESARRSSCEGKLHQLAVAMTHYVDARKQLPAAAPEGTVGGWAIELLPYLEEASLAEQFQVSQVVDPVSPPTAVRTRPAVLTCPSAYDGDSSIAGVPASHYSARLIRSGKGRFDWEFGELFTNPRIPWVFSPEVPVGGPAELRPHGSGFNRIYGTGTNAGGAWFDTQ